MEFEWDPQKEQVNEEKHGIRFEEARHIFDGPVLTRVDDREDYGEVRYISLGVLSPAVVLAVVYTRRQNRTRLISARKANRKERQVYHDYLKKKAEGD